MDRKHFLQTIIPVAAVAALHGKANAGNTILQASPLPNNLQAGDVVGITCPASPVMENRLLSCMKALNKWGLNVQLGETVGKQWQRFGGTDEERLADFQRMLDDDNVKAILFGKGGYGMMRIIDKVNWESFLKKPKWLIGFSDLTTIHLHVHANFELPTLHADMATGLGDDIKDISSTSLHDVLFGNRIEYTVPGHAMNREGYASGKLVGGNLSLLQACAASRSDINTEGKILFIEDVSEYKYTIDRMMMNVKRSGKLSNLAGLVVGMFSATKKEVEDSFTENIEDIIMDKVAEYKYPVCFGFPAGHIKNNYALKMGVSYDLNISKKSVTLFEKLLPDMPVPTAPKMMMQDTLIKVETIEDL